MLIPLVINEWNSLDVNYALQVNFDRATNDLTRLERGGKLEAEILDCKNQPTGKVAAVKRGIHKVSQ